MPEDLNQLPEVREFLHAYCQRGESYRHGPLFRRVGEEEWLHLNQTVHEYWLDAVKVCNPHITKSEQEELDKLLEEYADCVGDANTSNAKRQSTSNGTVP